MCVCDREKESKGIKSVRTKEVDAFGTKDFRQCPLPLSKKRWYVCVVYQCEGTLGPKNSESNSFFNFFCN